MTTSGSAAWRRAIWSKATLAGRGQRYWMKSLKSKTKWSLEYCRWKKHLVYIDAANMIAKEHCHSFLDFLIFAKKEAEMKDHTEASIRSMSWGNWQYAHSNLSFLVSYLCTESREPKKFLGYWCYGWISEQSWLIMIQDNILPKPSLWSCLIIVPMWWMETFHLALQIVGFSCRFTMIIVPFWSATRLVSFNPVLV